jgi:hypothetical protein
MTVINESGLYSVILRSNKPEAKRLKKWVTSEVLPMIRKTGGYRGRASPDDMFILLRSHLSLGRDRRSQCIIGCL